MSVGVQAQIRRNAECLRDYFRDLDEWQKECNSRKNTVSGKLKVCKRQDEFRIDLRSHQGEGTDTSHDFKNLDEQTVSDALSAKGVQEHISGSSSAKYKCADHVKNSLPSQSKSGEGAGVEEQSTSKTRIRVIKSGSVNHGDSSHTQSKADTQGISDCPILAPANALKNKGNELFSRGKYAEACKAYTEGIGLGECLLAQMIETRVETQCKLTTSPLVVGGNATDRNAAAALVPRAVGSVEKVLSECNSHRLEPVNTLAPIDLPVQLDSSRVVLEHEKAAVNYLAATELLSVLLSNRGASLYYQKKYVDSIQSCSAAVYFSRKNAKAFHRRALAFASTQKYAAAVRDIGFAFTAKALTRSCCCRNGNDPNTRCGQITAQAHDEHAISIFANCKRGQEEECKDCVFLRRLCNDYRRIKTSWTLAEKAAIQRRVTCLQKRLEHGEVPGTKDKMPFNSVRILHISQYEGIDKKTGTLVLPVPHLGTVGDGEVVEDEQTSDARKGIQDRTDTGASRVGRGLQTVDIQAQAFEFKSQDAGRTSPDMERILPCGESPCKMEGRVGCTSTISEWEHGEVVVSSGTDHDSLERGKAEDKPNRDGVTTTMRVNDKSYQSVCIDIPKSYFVFESTWRSYFREVAETKQGRCCGGRAASLLMSMAKVGRLRNILEHCIDPNIFFEIIATLRKLGSCLRRSDQGCRYGEDGDDSTLCPPHEQCAHLEEPSVENAEEGCNNSTCMCCKDLVGSGELRECNIRSFCPKDFVAAVLQVRETRQLPLLLGLAGPVCKSQFEAVAADADHFQEKMYSGETCRQK